MQIDEKKVEDAFAKIRSSLNLALLQELDHLEALAERIRVELLIERLDRERRDVYRSIINLLESELERRYQDSDKDRDTVRKHVVRYFHRLVADLTQADK